MSIIIDYETEKKLELDYETIIREVVEKSLDLENCPYEVELNVIITDNEGIKEINQEYRGIDAPTDVLSFPLIDYLTPSDFSRVEEEVESCFNPETGELLLGDIILSVDKIIAQAEEYGHSQQRELAFLVAHSMMHLFGYDHLEEDERLAMEKKQEHVLEELKIYR